MEAFWIILSVAGVITLIIGSAFFVRNYRVNKLRKNVKKGDKVGFFVDGDKEWGEVTTCWKNHVNIKSAFSKKVIRRSKKEIY